MSDTNIDNKRRRFLIKATSAVGTVGLGAIVIPFISSLTPSARALAAGAPVEVDISKVEPGQLIRVIWQGKPVWVVNRTKEMLDALPSVNPKLKDPTSVASIQPAYTLNESRARKPNILVMVGICTHLGCSPTYRPEVAAADLGADWAGGFYCPCHGSRFDLAGRVIKGSPAGTNMTVPPHYYKTDEIVRIGEDDAVA